MKIKTILFGLLFIGLISCNSTKKNSKTPKTYSDVRIVAAMKNVMWKGELKSSIDMDTITNKKGLYGLGPESFLTGELLINNGDSYVSRVTSDSTMYVEKSFNVSAPFFVYANINTWTKIDLPSDIKTIDDLEKFIDEKTLKSKRPFCFKLIGKISSAVIHIQNLPIGTKVSSPEDAHQGQRNYNLVNETVIIIGFFSTKHKGIFTHHDSFLHMHLISEDKSKMGHLDQLKIDTMKLYLARN